MKPDLPTFRAGRVALVALGLLAGVKAIGWILLATALARGLSHLAMTLASPDASQLLHLLFNPPSATDAELGSLQQHLGASDFRITVIVGAAGLLLRAVAVWAQQVMARRAAIGEKERLRADLVATRLDRAGAPADEAGTDAVLASKGLDGLDKYFTEYLPALMSALVVPLVLGVWVLIYDWVSALIVVLTIPLIPMFMILIGRYTEERVDDAAAGLGRLSHHLLELARGLPVLVGLRRAGFQRQALQRVSERYRSTTMSTLKSAFMSGFALELISTLSVAVVAVFIGVRLIYGEMDLHAGLLILILAPEIYLPFRDIGSAYHSSEDGLEAMHRARQRLEMDPPRTLAHTVNTANTAKPDDLDDPMQSDDGVQLGNLTIAYRHRDSDHEEDGTTPAASTPVVDGVTACLAPGELTVFAAASGTGKSTALRALAGILRDDEAEFSGTVTGLLHKPTAWLDQHPNFTEPTVAQEVRGSATKITEAQARSALDAVALAGYQNRSCDDLSPGERRRLGVARVLARLMARPDPGATAAEQDGRSWLVVLDEPTAHLDPAAGERVRATLVDLVSGRLPDGRRISSIVVVASHDTGLHQHAHQLLSTGHHQNIPVDQQPALAQTPQSAPTPVSAAQLPEFGGQDDASEAGVVAGALNTDPITHRDQEPAVGWWQMVRMLPWGQRKFVWGIAWAVAALLSGALLSALSGWLIVQAGYRPPVLYLLAVIVAVRFFGIGRALFRYLERLAVHDAVLQWANRLRLRVWDGLGAQPSAWNRLRRSGGALSLLISDVDELRDAVPRVLVPVPAAAITWVLTLVVVSYMAPPAWWPVVVAGILGLIVIPALVALLDRRTTVAMAEHRGWLMQRITVLFTAAADLSGNQASAAASRRFRDQDAASARTVKRTAWVAGLGQGLVALVAGWAAVQTVWISLSEGVSAPSAALAVFMVLALAEPFGLVATAVQEGGVVRHQLGRLTPVLGAAESQAPGHWVHRRDTSGSTEKTTGAPSSGMTVALDDVTAAYGDTTVFSDVSLDAGPGDFVVVTGPSGSGKSTVLAMLLGFLRPEHGTYTITGDQTTDASDTDEQLSGIAWCPQEAHLFDSSLRSNLLLARDPEDRAEDAELAGALHTVGLGDWLVRAPQGLDTRLGPSGHFLSGGQRQRVAVARALLNHAQTVLLDEPTAHLGADEAATLVQDLRYALREHTVVMVTHDERFAHLGTDSLALQ